MTQVWFRNPKLWVRELAEVGASNIAWDRGFCAKYHIDPYQFSKLYFGENGDWRSLLIGSQGTAELSPNHNIDNPVGVYPTWVYGEDELSLLEEVMQYPVGEDERICNADAPPDELPVFGQEHRVVVVNLPDTRTGPGKGMLRTLKELQEEYSNCILHIHNLHGFRNTLGLGWGAADVELRTDAANGRVILPHGKTVQWPRTVGEPQWVRVLGFSVPDLKVPRNRCMFNIKSALWAGENWDKNFRFKVQGKHEVDYKSVEVKPVMSSAVSAGLAQAGDKRLCDTCSLQKHCKYYRNGAVCSVPGTEASRLARFFHTRDSGLIIDGLGRIMEIQAARVERGLQVEEALEELDPEVSAGLKTIFDEGVKLAKLVDPSLTKPGVQVNVGEVAAAGGGEKALVARAVGALEARGIDRSDITPEMLEMMVSEQLGIRPPAIAAADE